MRVDAIDMRCMTIVYRVCSKNDVNERLLAVLERCDFIA